MKVSALVTVAGNVLLSLLGVAWAYTSYRYNLLNVGGGVGDVDFWDSARELVPIAFLAAWAAALMATVAIGVAHRSAKLRVSFQVLATLFLGPSVLFVVHWFLHRGFPASPA